VVTCILFCTREGGIHEEWVEERRREMNMNERREEGLRSGEEGTLARDRDWRMGGLAGECGELGARFTKAFRRENSS
jgi:hypothetical protein